MRKQIISNLVSDCQRALQLFSFAMTVPFLTAPATAATTEMGINVSGSTATSAIENYASITTKLGLKSVRFFFPIYTFHPSGDSAPYYYGDNVSQLQTKINTFSNLGYKVTVTFSGNPCESTLGCPPAPATLTTLRSDGSYQTEFDTYLVQLFSNLGSSVMNKISRIELWNEEDDGYGYQYTSNGKTYTSPYSAADFVEKILHGGSLTIRKLYPQIEIIAGAAVTNDEGADGEARNYLGQEVAAGAGNYVDGFSYHPYVSNIQNLDTRLAAAQTSIAPTLKSLVITEWGCLNCSVSTTAAVISGAMAVIAAHGVEAAFYYLLAETPTNSSALIDSNNNPVAGLFSVFQTALSVFENSVVSTPAPTPQSTTAPTPTPSPTSSPTPAPTPSPTPSSGLSAQTVQVTCGSTINTNPLECSFKPVSDQAYPEPTVSLVSTATASECTAGPGYSMADVNGTWQLWTNHGCLATFAVTYAPYPTTPITSQIRCGSLTNTNPIDCSYRPLSDKIFAEPSVTLVSTNTPNLCSAGPGYSFADVNGTWQLWTNHGCLATFSITYERPIAPLKSAVVTCGSTSNTNPMECAFTTLSDQVYTQPTISLQSTNTPSVCNAGPGYTVDDVYGNWQIWTNHGCLATFVLTY